MNNEKTKTYVTYIKPERLDDFRLKAFEYGFEEIGNEIYIKRLNETKKILVWASGKVHLSDNGEVIHDIPFDVIGKLVWDGMIIKTEVENE